MLRGRHILRYGLWVGWAGLRGRVVSSRLRGRSGEDLYVRHDLAQNGLQTGVHLLARVVLEVEIHLDLPSVVRESRRRIDLVQASQLPLHRPLGRQDGVVFLRVGQPVVDEGQGIVALYVKPVQGRLAALDGFPFFSDVFREAGGELLEPRLDLVDEVVLNVPEIGHEGTLLDVELAELGTQDGPIGVEEVPLDPDV